MKKISFLFVLFHATFVLAQQQNANRSNVLGQIPVAKKIPVTDSYFGMQITDNYRWLENMNNPEVQNWFKAQHDYTNNFLDRIPGRDSLLKDLQRLDALI